MTHGPMTRRAFLAGLGAAALLAALPAPAWALSITTATLGQVQVLSLRGKVTMGDGDFALRQAIHDTLNSGAQRIVLDLGGVTAMDSSGVGEMVSSYTTVTNRGGRLVLANLPNRIADILTITQLITVFDVYDSVDQAVAALSA
ncbi:STAS domain-containing protein [Novispirillum sp. DQ9]|uniref:STAS domain-containing protein n=1 Tax=Novispirillum sp. DQ9 TaxID=3398612 RepID=UPI003C7BD1CA